VNRSRRVAGLVAGVFLAVSLHSAPAEAAGPWKPALHAKWQWQLSSVPTKAQIDALTGQVDFWDVDGFDTPKATVDYIHSKGDKAVCYMSAGSFENWRPDAATFPAAVKGKNLDGWAGEKWLDVRAGSVLTIMNNRARLCASKGFDAVEWDNVDGYSNKTGFPLTAADQLTFNRSLAQLTHLQGMSVALKNDVDQVTALQPSFDFAINEECATYNECGPYSAFVKAGKFVGQVEYTGKPASFCPAAVSGGRSAMKKTLDLTASRTPC
jgi:hypothetical protein